MRRLVNDTCSQQDSTTRFRFTKRKKKKNLKRACREKKKRKQKEKKKKEGVQRLKLSLSFLITQNIYFQILKRLQTDLPARFRPKGGILLLGVVLDDLTAAVKPFYIGLTLFISGI